MRARTFCKVITTAVINRGSVCLPTAMVLALAVGPGSAVAAGHSTTTSLCLRSATVQIPATAGPSTIPGGTGAVDTGVCVHGAVRVTATGAIEVQANGPSFGPEGDTGFPLSDERPWSLIGRIGDGPWQYIGAGPTTLVGHGELYLAVDDDYYADNSGFFTATISRCPLRIFRHRSSE